MLVSSHLMSELQDTADHLVVAGRGQVIADTSVAALIEAASGERVELRTTARAEAMTVLAHAGAEVAATAPDVLTVSGLSSERIVATLAGSRVPFSEVSAHRATLEEAYMELTRDAVEFRGGGRRHDHDHPLPLGPAAGTATGSRSSCARSGPSSARSAAGSSARSSRSS